jgi:hypothetical protein
VLAWEAVGTAVAVVLLYGAACLLPATCCAPEGERCLALRGWVLLWWGWCGGETAVPWSANIALALGLSYLAAGWYRAAVLAGVAAAALGLTTWWVLRGNTFLEGYYLWQASHVALGAGAAGALARRRVGREAGRGIAGPVTPGRRGPVAA